MNHYQKLVLMAVITIILGMLVFPPFQVIAQNGVVYNQGYGWLFDPPKFGNIGATVNAQILLIQWIGVLVVGGLAYVIATNSPSGMRASGVKTKNECAASTQPDPESVSSQSVDLRREQKTVPTGVGGWLLFLIVRLTVLVPVLGTVGGYAHFVIAEHGFPALSQMDEWRQVKTTFMLVSLGVAAIAIYGGLGLARGDDWSVVKRAKAILWITGPGALLVLVVLLPIITGESIVEEFISLFPAAVVDAAIWTTYLSRSKRVRNTYIR